MTGRGEQAAEWMYRGLWGVIVHWLRVPDEPPALPVHPGAGESSESFQPAPGFLRYLKFWFWLLLWPIDIAILIGWIAITIAEWWLGLLLLMPALILAIVPDIIAYVALHLRYDTTWYVMTPRSLRIRRGVWSIRETTITFENVQNVKVTQGPVQRHFGIANLVVETAGAGGDPRKKGVMPMNQGVIEGVADAARLRDVILARLRESKSAGLGDEELESPPQRGWTPAHVAVLREIRDEVAALHGSATA